MPVCVCVCVHTCTCMYALRIVSTGKILCFIHTSVIIMLLFRGMLCLTEFFCHKSMCMYMCVYACCMPSYVCTRVCVFIAVILFKSMFTHSLLCTSFCLIFVYIYLCRWVSSFFWRFIQVYCKCYAVVTGCVNLSFSYVEGESLLMALKDVALSSGRYGWNTVCLICSVFNVNYSYELLHADFLSVVRSMF